MAVYIVLSSIFWAFFTGVPTMIAFRVGSVTSIRSGWIGLKIAVFTNVRTTHHCWKSPSAGFDVASRSGCVGGRSLVSLEVLALFVVIKIFKAYFDFSNSQVMRKAIAGYTSAAPPSPSLVG